MKNSTIAAAAAYAAAYAAAAEAARVAAEAAYHAADDAEAAEAAYVAALDAEAAEAAYHAALDADPVARTIAIGKEWLANCPAHPARTAPNLIGWHGPVGYVCVHCCGRLSGGGHNLRLFCATPLYNASECTCQLCGKTLH